MTDVTILGMALAAIAREDYVGAVRVIEPIRARIVEVGGSHAQRDDADAAAPEVAAARAFG